MLVKRSSEREWTPSGFPGIERSLFRNNDAGGRSSVVRLAAGSRFPRHSHQGTEEVLVLAGSVRIAEQDLLAWGSPVFRGARGAPRAGAAARDHLRVCRRGRRSLSKGRSGTPAAVVERFAMHQHFRAQFET